MGPPCRLHHCKDVLRTEGGFSVSSTLSILLWAYLGIAWGTLCPSLLALAVTLASGGPVFTHTHLVFCRGESGSPAICWAWCKTVRITIRGVLILGPQWKTNRKLKNIEKERQVPALP